MLKVNLFMYFIGLILFICSEIFIKIEVLKNILLIISLVLSGYHVLMEGIVDTIQQTKLNHKFLPNAHILMCISAVGSIVLGGYSEAVILILIFAGAHYLEEYVEAKSKKDITSLLKLKPTFARKIMNDTIEQVDVESIKVGDKLAVLNGDQIPLDGIVIKGKPLINEATINGESIPKEKQINDVVYAGTMNIHDYFEMEVTKIASDTLFAKILKLVSESQKNDSRLQSFISKYEPVYVKKVLIITPLIFMLFLNLGIEQAFYRTLVFLVSVSPCALAVSVTPASLAAISFLARNNVLFKQSRYLMYFKDIDVIAFDKTGTLTTGNMQIDGLYFENESDLKILYAIEAKSNHPIAQAIVHKLSEYKSNDLIEVENVVGKGVVFTHNKDDYYVGKPCEYRNTNLDVNFILNKHNTSTIVYFKKNDHLIGIICLVDTLKNETKNLICDLNKNNVTPIMITGDNENSAKYVANQLGLHKYYYNVLPDEKNSIICELQDDKKIVAMVGDGVNDAVALANADISIAMGCGSDVAIDTSDVVLMKDNISQISLIYNVSKRLDCIIKQNIIFSFSVICILFVLNFTSTTNIFTSVIGHEGSTFVILLNSLRLLFIKKV